MYVDFIKWAVVNIPGLRSVDIRSLVGDTLRICAYAYNPSHVKGMWDLLLYPKYDLKLLCLWI